MPKTRPSADPQGWIPNLQMGRDYDAHGVETAIHYETLQNLAAFFARDMPVHRHGQYLQIHYVHSGRVDFQIDDRVYDARGPCCFLTPPSAAHAFRTENEATGHVVTVHQSFVWQLMREAFRDDGLSRLQSGICVTPLELERSRQGEWNRLGETLAHIQLEWSGQDPTRHFMLEHLVRMLVVQIMRLPGQAAYSTETRSDALGLFQQFSQLVEDHFRDGWRLADYVERLGVSQSKLNQTCKQIADTAPKQLIHDRLLREARRLLLLTDLSAKAIGYQLGFTEPGYFSRFFTQRTGATPRAYRRQQLPSQPAVKEVAGPGS